MKNAKSTTRKAPRALGESSAARSADTGRLVRQRTAANTRARHADTDDDAARLAMLEGFDPAKATVRAKRAAEQDIEDAVIAARANGVTWTEIGAALGITHQGAIKRYGHRRAVG